MSATDYKVNLTNSAQKGIRNLDKATLKRALDAVRALAVNPRPPRCRKLAGAPGPMANKDRRYRVIYSICDSHRTVEVIAARHRCNAYG
jgi:mRNA interferase RelE/StbE